MVKLIRMTSERMPDKNKVSKLLEIMTHDPALQFAPDGRLKRWMRQNPIE